MTDAKKIEQEAVQDAKVDFEIAEDKLEILKQKVEGIDIPKKDLLAGIGIFSSGLYFGSRLPRFLRKIVSSLTLSLNLLILLEMVFGDKDAPEDQLRPDDATDHPESRAK